MENPRSQQPRVFSKISEAEVKAVILRARIALGIAHLEFTEDDLAARAKEFMDVLDADLPADRFEEVYVAAMRAKENSFDLSVTELNKAWRTIKGDEYKPTYYKCLGCRLKESGERDSCPFHDKGK